MGRVLAHTESEVLVNQEFELTDKDFKFIQWFMHKHAGIYFSDRKRTMVYGRISRQLRRLQLRCFSDYRQMVEQDPRERARFINCLTTNKTQFFREYHHFEFLEKVLITEWQQQGVSEVSIWSAGCSTGEEPYSFISSLHKAGALDKFASVRITATDLDTRVLKVAKLGIYSDEALEVIPQSYLKSCFVKGVGVQHGKIKVRAALQRYLHFQQLNLLQDWPFDHEFDLISCRNVMIYFDKKTQTELIERFYHQLKPNGVLLIGHSESMPSHLDLFHHLGHTIYVKK